jgi:hypothetical protein
VIPHTTAKAVSTPTLVPNPHRTTHDRPAITVHSVTMMRDRMRSDR